jgi:hypothetical protein
MVFTTKEYPTMALQIIDEAAPSEEEVAAFQREKDAKHRATHSRPEIRLGGELYSNGLVVSAQPPVVEGSNDIAVNAQTAVELNEQQQADEDKARQERTQADAENAEPLDAGDSAPRRGRPRAS